MKKAVFIDKDGTLIKNVPYNVDRNLVELEAGAGKALRLLRDNGFLLVIISNQDGIAKGLITWKQLDEINKEIQEKLLPNGVGIDAFYYCPHYPDTSVNKYAVECDCRKPKPGLLLHAVKDLDIDISESWMIGDILHDVEAGNRAGCTGILIDNGNETEWQLNENRTPQYTVTNLLEAAEIIVANVSEKAMDYENFMA